MFPSLLPDYQTITLKLTSLRCKEYDTHMFLWALAGQPGEEVAALGAEHLCDERMYPSELSANDLPASHFTGTLVFYNFYNISLHICYLQILLEQI